MQVMHWNYRYEIGKGIVSSLTLMGKYRIESDGAGYVVICDSGEIVGVFPTEDAAKQEIERCQKEDAMWESAKLLVGRAIKIHMQLHGVDRQTARYWVISAIEAGD
jgi:hypothetical protein